MMTDRRSGYPGRRVVSYDNECGKGDHRHLGSLEEPYTFTTVEQLVADVVPRAVELDPSLDEGQVTVAMTRLDAIWDQLFPAEQQRIVRLLVEKVIVSPRDMEVRLRANGIEELTLELCPAVPEEVAA